MTINTQPNRVQNNLISYRNSHLDKRKSTLGTAKAISSNAIQLMMFCKPKQMSVRFYGLLRKVAYDTLWLVHIASPAK